MPPPSSTISAGPCPIPQPQSLSDPEVYALSAYLLHLNGLIGADAVMDASTLPQVRMPNRDGFIPLYPTPPQ